MLLGHGGVALIERWSLFKEVEITEIGAVETWWSGEVVLF